MLDQAPALLSDNQTLITAKGFLGQKRNQCWSVKGDGKLQPLPSLRSNAEETDLQIWLHCVQSTGLRTMFYSPDTDIYNIGLPIVCQQHPQPDVYVQLHGRCKDFHRYLHVNSFLQALDADPDIAQVPPEKRANILRMVYIATGCDYISYFKGISRVLVKFFFLNVFSSMQHSSLVAQIP